MIISFNLKIYNFFFFFYATTLYSDSSGWSKKIRFKTPPAGGTDEVRFLAYGDMGKAPRDPSAEHYIQVILTNISIKSLINNTT